MTDLAQAQDALRKLAELTACYLKGEMTAEETMAAILEMDAHPGWVAAARAGD